MKLYHFTTVESFAKIWVSKQLKFSETKNLNDVFEKHKQFMLSRGIIPRKEGAKVEGVLNDFGKVVYKILAEYKQISFSIDSKKEEGFKSSMMWGQYAHNENGVCIEFDSDKLPHLKDVFRGKVQYTYNLPNINFVEDTVLDEKYLNNYFQRNRKMIFFTKHKHWEHENEYRFVSKGVDFLPIENAITKVYVFRKSEINTNVVERLINGDVDIDYMSISTLRGNRQFVNSSLKQQRLYEERIKNEPDYYTNPEKVKKRLENIFKKFGINNNDSAISRQ